MEDIVGKKINSWTILEYIKSDPIKGKMYKGQCACGNIRINIISRFRRYIQCKTCAIRSNFIIRAKKNIGKQDFDWTILGISDKRGSRNAILYRCQCRCGLIKDRILTTGKKQHGKKCANCNKAEHCFRETIGPSQIGKSFGRWTIIGLSKKRYKGAKYFLCKCECGKIAEILWPSLRLGLSRGCIACHNKHNSGMKDKAQRNKSNILSSIYSNNDMDILNE